MPPKGKKNKKQDDDWEAEALGETPDPIAAATAEAKAADDAKDAEDEGASGGGGGLLAALKKNRGKRVKKGKPTNDFVDGEDLTAENGATDSPAPEPAVAEEATADDIFAEPVKGKGAKGAKGKPAPTPAKGDEDDDSEEGGDGRVKTKKEKEKEKKEREKQRKKEQAQKKKAATPAKASEPVKETVAEKAPEPEPAAAATGKDGKKKKVPAHLAALQKQMEQRRQQEEEAARLRAEQEEAEREAQRIEEEQSRKDAEAKERRKQKEKEKKEELKKQGLLLTKAQKEAKARAEQAREQMLAAGMKVAGLADEPTEKKKVVYENKKKGKGPSKAEEEAKRLEEAKKAAEAEAERLAREREQARKEAERLKAEEEAAAGAAEESELEDWEKAVEEEDDIKDSWDADTDEEEAAKEAVKEATEVSAKATGTGKPATNGTAAKAMQGTEKKQLPVRELKAGQVDESDSDSEEDSSEDDEQQTSTQRQEAARKAAAAARREQRIAEAKEAQSRDNLRSPICCILGHVDTGKTKLLDKIRQTNVQEGEAGGITQQIGATFFPVDALQQKTAVVNKDGSFEFKIPGLLVIDTPGHESFTNLRSRGSSLCNIAILVVDIMHGLEPQTLESMRLLRERKTPFIVALNKIDRLYGWKRIDNNGFQDSLSLQSKSVQTEFKNRLDQTKVAFAEQGFNAEVFYENPNMRKNVSLVPTSAHTGEGIPDMIKLITELTQNVLTNNLMYLSECECTILEVKVIEGLGTTIDVVLSNGVLKEGDRIVLCGLNGPIATNIRALLTPAPLKELRVKSAYVHHQEVKASLGIKIAANDLEHAIAGSRLLVVGPDDDEEDLEEEVMSDIENLLSRVSKTGRGVSVQASTLGSLEALLEFLKVSKIPVANISIGPVYKRDVMQCGVMLEKAKEYAVMLCFDVKVDPEAARYAADAGVKIFQADIIYHLFDNFTAHMAQLAEQRKEESKMLAVFPCVLKPVAVFNKTDPIVVGVDVTEGNLRPLTPIAVVKTNPVTGVKDIISLGRVTSIERDHKVVPICKKGQPSVAVKIEGANQPTYGRQLEEGDTLYSLISRRSIDTLKEFFRSDVSNDEWALIKKMKPLFDIP